MDVEQISSLAATYHPGSSSDTTLGGKGMLRWPRGAVAQWSGYLQLKQEALGSIPGSCPGFLFSFSWLILMQMG